MPSRSKYGVILIANLLLSFLKSSLERSWNFSGLATMVRMVLMYYLNLYKFFNRPDLMPTGKTCLQKFLNRLRNRQKKNKGACTRQ